MKTRQLLTAGLLTSALLGLAEPALARPDDGRDNTDRQSQGRRDANSNPRAQRDATPRPGSYQAQTHVQTPPPVAPAPAVPQQFRATDRTQPAAQPVLRPAAQDNPRTQRGYTPRPGSYEAQNNAPPSRQNWSGDQGRPGSRDQDRTRDQDRARDQDRTRDQDRSRDQDRWRDQDRTRDRDRPTQNWGDRDGRYTPRPQIQDRWQDHRPWRDDWRQDRRYDWQDYRRAHRDRYRLPTYYPPYGWNRGYFRFWSGVYLDNFLFSMTYWINDPYYYRLPPAYGSLRWVRYYNDALLVDIRDGYVVDVVYNVFW